MKERQFQWSVRFYLVLINFYRIQDLFKFFFTKLITGIFILIFLKGIWHYGGDIHCHRR